MSPAYQVIRGGRVLDTERRSTDNADIVIAGDTIVEIGAPGIDAPQDAVVVDASDRLVMPGLVNAHTHGNHSLGKGLGDRWSLELLQNANAWMGGGFTLEDMYTAGLLNAAQMVLKGCTAAYDMYAEFPRPSLEGLSAVGRAYSEVGVRVVLWRPAWATARSIRRFRAFSTPCRRRTAVSSRKCAPPRTRNISRPVRRCCEIGRSTAGACGRRSDPRFH